MNAITPHEKKVLDGLIDEFGVNVPVELSDLLQAIGKFYPARAPIQGNDRHRIVRQFIYSGLLRKSEEGKSCYSLTAKTPAVESVCHVAFQRAMR